MVRAVNSLVLLLPREPLIKQSPPVKLSALSIAKTCSLFHFANLSMVWCAETRVLFQTKGFVLRLDGWDLEKQIFSRSLTSCFKNSGHQQEKYCVRELQRLWTAEICHLTSALSPVTTKKSSGRGCVLWADAINVAIGGLLVFQSFPYPPFSITRTRASCKPSSYQL